MNIHVLSIHVRKFSNQLSVSKVCIKDANLKRLLSEWTKIKKDYEELVILAKEINDVIGHSATFFLLELMLTYVTLLDDEKVFVGPFAGWQVLLSHIFYSCMDYPTCLGLAGNICCQVKIHFCKILQL